MKSSSSIFRYEKIWRNSNVSQKVKLQLYELVILLIILYSAKLWPVTGAIDWMLLTTDGRGTY